MTIRSIQNYKYTQTEIDTVVTALKQGHKVPRKLATKFRFFHLDSASEKLIHDGRTLIAMENQDVVIAEAYQATYAGINRLHAYLMAKYLGVKQSRVHQWLAKSYVQQQHRHQPAVGSTKPRIVHHPNSVWQVDLLFFHQVIIFVVVDLYSKFARVSVLRSKTAKSVTRAFERMLTEGCAPKAVSSDNGSEFKGEFSELLDKRGIQQVFGSPGNPTSQASVERFNRTIRMALERYITDGGTTWRRFLKDWIVTYNSLKNLATGFTPNALQSPSSEVIGIVKSRRDKQVQKLLAQRKKVNYEPLNVADLVRVKIWRKGCKKALPEYSAETHSVVQILKSKYNWEEFKLSNGGIYTRDHVLKIPAGTE
jgi:IS30 family transposase